MLNEWSDRAPEPRKRWIASGQFWLGVLAAFVGLALAVQFGSWFLGLFG